MASVADKVFNLIKETVENEGVSLWDVKFVKEGASHYLRIFIDKADGVSIDDCTNVSHAVDGIIDEADPIDVSYYLEVCSPGIERELSKPDHFKSVVGKKIKIKLYKALDGKKEFTGILKSAENGPVIETEEKVLELFYKEISKANLCDFE